MLGLENLISDIFEEKREKIVNHLHDTITDEFLDFIIEISIIRNSTGNSSIFDIREDIKRRLANKDD